MRLSIISLAGIVRTLVAVGTERLASMFAARDFDIPRSGVTTLASSAGGADSVPVGFALAAVGASAGIGCGLACTEVVRATGREPVGGAGDATGLSISAGI